MKEFSNKLGFKRSWLQVNIAKKYRWKCLMNSERNEGGVEKAAASASLRNRLGILETKTLQKSRINYYGDVE